MTFAPIIASSGRPVRRHRHFSANPGLLPAAGLLLLFLLVTGAAIVHGVPQLDPQAQTFVVP